MPKKRHQPKYSKPPSVAPASLLLSSPSHSTSEHHDRSVNELLANLRRSTLNSQSVPSSSNSGSSFSAATTPSVPPALRHILQLPEPPAPVPRRPQRRDLGGRRPPPGPPPPRSWVTFSQSRRATSSNTRHDGAHGHIRYWPMPGVYAPAEGSLMDLTLQHMALGWAQQRDWNRFYIYTLPSRLRSALLTRVSEIHSPGVSLMDLRLVLCGPPENELGEYGLEPPDMNMLNSDFFTLDLTGSLGRSLTIKELQELLFGPKKATAPTDVVQDSWDLPSPVAGPVELLPNLTHLSLAVDPDSTLLVSWKQLLSLSEKLTQLTHLSLAGWPEPSLTPNAKLAKVVSPTTGRSVQYGGTGPYSHVLDGDWTEAILVLKRLSRLLYSLEYLDLTGCGDWIRALREESDGEFRVDFVDWSGDWGKITNVRLNSGYRLTDNSSIAETLRFSGWVDEAIAVEKHIRAQRAGRGRWITVERDTVSETAQAIVEREKLTNFLNLM
ncbi:tafazzin [Xylaria venustula]|nr:tafazzin [Xylaria venustula]